MRLAAAVGWTVAGLLVAASPALAWDIGDFFPPQKRSESPTAAALLERAREQLRADGQSRIEITRQAASGEVERQVFVMLRRKVGDSQRIITEELTVDRTGPWRMLLIEEPGRRSRAFAFVRQIRPEPFSTTFRLADPLLCTWYDSEDGAADGQPASTQILSQRPGSIDGERVYWLTVEPGELRRFHHSELAIAASDQAILEERHFLAPRDKEAELVVRLPRAQMVSVEGRVLPGAAVYQDRGTGETVRVELTHAPLPLDLGRDSFSPEAFHRSVLSAPAPPVASPPDGGP